MVQLIPRCGFVLPTPRAAQLVFFAQFYRIDPVPRCVLRRQLSCRAAVRAVRSRMDRACRRLAMVHAAVRVRSTVATFAFCRWIGPRIAQFVAAQFCRRAPRSARIGLMPRPVRMPFRVRVDRSRVPSSFPVDRSLVPSAAFGFLPSVRRRRSPFCAPFFPAPFPRAAAHLRAAARSRCRATHSRLPVRRAAPAPRRAAFLRSFLRRSAYHRSCPDPPAVLSCCLLPRVHLPAPRRYEPFAPMLPAVRTFAVRSFVPFTTRRSACRRRASPFVRSRRALPPLRAFTCVHVHYPFVRCSFVRAFVHVHRSMRRSTCRRSAHHLRSPGFQFSFVRTLPTTARAVRLRAFAHAAAARSYRDHAARAVRVRSRPPAVLPPFCRAVPVHVAFYPVYTFRAPLRHTTHAPRYAPFLPTCISFLFASIKFFKFYLPPPQLVTHLRTLPTFYRSFPVRTFYFASSRATHTTPHFASFTLYRAAHTLRSTRCNFVPHTAPRAARRAHVPAHAPHAPLPA